MTKRRILVIEDEESISEPLSAALSRDGFSPVVAGTVAEGVEAFRTRSPDLILLDVMLPDGDGRDVLRQIRATARTPVIMLTARGDEMDRVIGLELGADDYVTKPFSAAEVVARIRAVMRRTAAPAPSGQSEIEVGELRMDPDPRYATKEGSTVARAPQALALLA